MMLRKYALSWALGVLFLGSWLGQAYWQLIAEGETWGAFWASTLENWQSEFLQLLTFVILSAYLIHKDSPQSRDGSDRLEEKIDTILKKLDASHGPSYGDQVERVIKADRGQRNNHGKE